MGLGSTAWFRVWGCSVILEVLVREGEGAMRIHFLKGPKGPRTQLMRF